MFQWIINFGKKNKGTTSSQTYSTNKQQEGEKPMAEQPTFTDKERNLFIDTVFERELGIVTARNVADLRSKTDIFANDNIIEIEKVSNKQGTTRVNVFVVSYEDLAGNEKSAYIPTI